MYSLLMLLPWYFFAMKTKFNHFESWWILYILLWINLFKFHANLAILLGVVLTILPQSRYMFIWTCNFFMSIISREGANLMGPVSTWTFKNGLNVRLNKSISSQPTIYIFNYPANNLEYYYPFLFCPIKLLISIDAIQFTKYVFGEDWTIKCDSNLNEVGQDICDAISSGKNIAAYIERNYKKRKSKWDIDTDLRSGVFYIAKKFNIPLCLVCASHINHACGIVLNGSIDIYVDEPLDCNQMTFNEFKTYAINFWQDKLSYYGMLE